MKLFKSIFCLLCFANLLLVPAAMQAGETPALILLRGACSCGKNILCEQIQAQGSELQVIDLDPIYMRHVVDLITETFPEECMIISREIPSYNLYHALKRNEVTLEGEAQEALTKIQTSLDGHLGKSFQAKLRENLQTHLLDLIEIAFQEGRDVLMNTWLPMGFIEENFESHPTLNVLIYSSLPASFQMLKKRNQKAVDSGDLSDKRFLGQLFSSFNSFFRLAIEESASSLGVNSLSEIEAIFEQASDEVTQNWDIQEEAIFSQREMNLLDLANAKKEFLPEGIQDDVPLFVEAKKHYDIIICTQNRNPEDLVAQLFEELGKRIF